MANLTYSLNTQKKIEVCKKIVMIPFSICLGVATVYLGREKCVAGY
jgi:hypothetical protein